MIKNHSRLVFLLSVTVFCFSALFRVSASEPVFFDQTFGDFSEELALAKEEGKAGVFIFLKWKNVRFVTE